MLSQTCAGDIRDFEDITGITGVAGRDPRAGGSREAGAGPWAVIDAAAWPGLPGLARLLGEVPAGEYDAGYGPAGAADWYVPSRASYSLGGPACAGELLVRFAGR